MNVKKTKVMVFNYANPCQKFVFEDDMDSADLQISGDPTWDHLELR